MDLTLYLNELLTLSFLAIFMAISPGADFIMVTRNSIFYGRNSSLYSAIGISIAIWVHVAYSIAGIAVIISNSVILFSIIKYLGAAYLIYIGWKTFTSKSIMSIEKIKSNKGLSTFKALKVGFITNVLNPKTTIFFLSIFTQLVTVDTPIWIQIVYGFIISLAHLIWFIIVSYLFSHPVLLNKFTKSKRLVERLIGTVLIAFGLKMALSTNN